MRKLDLSKLPDADLVREYEQLIVNESYAEARGDKRMFRELFKAASAFGEELKRRGAREKLEPLLRHESPWVRYKTAQRLMAVMPQEARAVLESLAETRVPPASLHAAMTLYAIDTGLTTPT